jgi:adrenodoxin-NADP+ reductase
VSLNELRSLYNAVILAYGAESDRRLGIPGEDLKTGVYPAREFVQWYNGHPSAASLKLPDFSTVTSVAICGLGNVALDIARVLLQPVERLAVSDAAEHAVVALRNSSVRDVHLLGRRGPAQAAFTPKELRELLAMEGIRVKIHPEGCLDCLSPACTAEIKGNRIKRRIVEVLGKAIAEGENKPGYVGKRMYM